MAADLTAELGEPSATAADGELNALKGDLAVLDWEQLWGWLWEWARLKAELGEPSATAGGEPDVLRMIVLLGWLC